MLLAALAFTLLASPQSAPASAPTSAAPAAAADDGGAVKTWENLDVFRRMLLRQIGAKHDAISTAPKKDDDGEVDVFTPRDGRVASETRVTDGNGVGAGTDKSPDKPSLDTVANAFTRARNSSWYETTLGSNAEFAPGLGAIIGVTVPVKVRIVTSEPKGAEAKKPADTKNPDDEAWERLARGDDSADRHVRQLLGSDGKGKEEPRRELRFDDAAVKALKETVVDTVSRFGSRLGLGHGERLAIVVSLTAGSVVGDGSSAGAEKKNEPVGNFAPANTILYFQSQGESVYGLNGFDRRTVLPGRRFVVQVSGDDLRAHKSGDLDRDELLRKMRIEEFTLPAASSLSPGFYDWSYRAPK